MSKGMATQASYSRCNTDEETHAFVRRSRRHLDPRPGAFRGAKKRPVIVRLEACARGRRRCPSSLMWARGRRLGNGRTVSPPPARTSVLVTSTSTRIVKADQRSWGPHCLDHAVWDIRLICRWGDGRPLSRALTQDRQEIFCRLPGTLVKASLQRHHVFCGKSRHYRQRAAIAMHAQISRQGPCPLNQQER